MKYKINSFLIWSLPTRIFHNLLIFLVLLVFITSDFDSLLKYHAIVGFTIGSLIIFRIAWGFLDVRYSKFKDFNFNLNDLKSYMFNIFGDKKQYLGHNPASSWAIVAMFLFALLSILSGIVVYGIQEGMGILSFLNISMLKDIDLFEDIHELAANSFMAIIFIHIAGVVIDRFLHNSKAVESMITGYKDGDNESLKLTLFQKLFAILWIGLSIFLLVYLLTNPSNILIADTNTNESNILVLAS